MIICSVLVVLKNKFKIKISKFNDVSSNKYCKKEKVHSKQNSLLSAADSENFYSSSNYKSNISKQTNKSEVSMFSLGNPEFPNSNFSVIKINPLLKFTKNENSNKSPTLSLTGNLTIQKSKNNLANSSKLSSRTCHDEETEKSISPVYSQKSITEKESLNVKLNLCKSIKTITKNELKELQKDSKDSNKVANNLNCLKSLKTKSNLKYKIIIKKEEEENNLKTINQKVENDLECLQLEKKERKGRVSCKNFFYYLNN